MTELDRGEVDPCPAASQVGRLPAWQHAHPVTCAGCGRSLRFAWWTRIGHACSSCEAALHPEAQG